MAGGALSWTAAGTATLSASWAPTVTAKRASDLGASAGGYSVGFAAGRSSS